MAINAITKTLFLILLSLTVLVGCNTTTFHDQAFKAWKEEVGKRIRLIEANYEMETNDVKITIDGVGIGEKGIIVFLTVDNKSSSEVLFYPSFGYAVADGIQLASTGFMPLGIAIDGELGAQAVKSGAVAYMVPGYGSWEVNDIKRLVLYLDEIIVGNKSEKVKLAIDF